MENDLSICAGASADKLPNKKLTSLSACKTIIWASGKRWSTETEVRKPKYGNWSMETEVRKWEKKQTINVLPTHDCALLSKGDCL